MYRDCATLASQLKRGENMKKDQSINLRIEPELKKQIVRTAKKDGVTVGALLRYILAAYFDARQQ